jgi:hypothetical protein
MKDKIAKCAHRVLKRINDLNPVLHTEHGRMVDKLLEVKAQRLILLTDQDFHTASRKLGITFTQDSLSRLETQGPEITCCSAQVGRRVHNEASIHRM